MTSQVFAGSSTDQSCGMRPFRWADAGLISGNNITCMQIGTVVYFWIEPTTAGLGYYDYSVDLFDYISSYTDPYTGDSYTSTTAQLQASTVDFAQINGKLVIVGEHNEPILVAYNTDDDTLNVTKLTIKERDLFGIEDGIDVQTTPTVLTNSHEYNLWNRGWSPANIAQFHTDLSKYPSKNMIHFKGMRKQVDATTADEDGTKLFVSAALEAELFQNMSAPQGHAIREVFNRRNAFQSTVVPSSSPYTITAVSNVSNLGNDQWTITLTTSAVHGVIVGNVIVLSGLTLRWRNQSGDSRDHTYEGSYTVTAVPSTTTLSITIGNSSNRTYVKALSYGTLTNTSVALVSTYNQDDSAIPIATRFTACSSFASRIFYAGCGDSRISNRVYFSKLVEVDTDLNRCYQEADPTSEFISDLIATDGGYIVLPEAGRVTGLMPFGASLIVFCTNGVWEIGPGASGFFSAIGYSVRKLSDIGCVSSRSIINAGRVPLYWGQDGVYAITQDPNSGFTTAQNITKDTINGLFNSIRYQEKTRAKACYDSIRQRVMWLYNSRLVDPITADAPATGEDMVQTTPVTPIGVITDEDTSNVSFDSLLIFDLRLGAWTRWVFGDSATHVVRDMLAMPASYITDNELRVKVFCQKITGTGTDLQTYLICDFSDETTFMDNGAEPHAFIYTGPDSLGEPERFRTAPYAHVFMRRIPNSSLRMQPRWDWARGHTSGKMGNYMQVYREIKPMSQAYGLLVTKNKVPGRGRNLFLAFNCETGKPAWIDGWTLKYDVNNRI